MIGLTRLNGRPIVLNAELIETIEATPDTVIALITGKKLVVREPPEDVVEQVVQYRQRAAADPLRAVGAAERRGQRSLTSHHED